MSSSTARLRIIQVTDCYTLANFPSLKTLIQQKRAEVAEMGGMTISLLTGDFLAPYLLSSFDKGTIHLQRPDFLIPYPLFHIQQMIFTKKLTQLCLLLHNRVGLVVVDLGWADFDLNVPPGLGKLLFNLT